MLDPRQEDHVPLNRDVLRINTRGGPGAAPVRFVFITFVVAACAAGACSHQNPPPDQPVTADSVDTVLARRSAELMRIPGVVGVGQALCDATPCIRVYIRDESVRARLPRSLDGVAIDAVVTGSIHPRTVD